MSRGYLRIDRSRIKAVSRLQHPSNDKTDRERDRRDGLKMIQRPQSDPTDALEIPIEEMPCTTVQKITGAIMRLKFLAGIWIEIAYEDPERDRDQNLDIENPIPGLIGMMPYLVGFSRSRCKLS